MKKAFLILSFFIFTFALTAQTRAQDKFDPEAAQQAIQDKILEDDAVHNLDVAKQYFKTKKAYKAVLLRFEETFAAYPQFSKIDEFLYLAGMSSFYLSEDKGKQKINYETLSDEDKEKYAPARLRENAVAYFGMIKENFPASKYRDNAEKMLKKLVSSEQ